MFLWEAHQGEDANLDAEKLHYRQPDHLRWALEIAKQILQRRKLLTRFGRRKPFYFDAAIVGTRFPSKYNGATVFDVREDQARNPKQVSPIK